MNKIVVFPVLFMLLLVPAFAQEGESGSGWTFSGGAQVSADLMYFSHGSGKIEPKTGDKEEWGSNIDGSLNVLSSSSIQSPGIMTYLLIGNKNEGDDWSYDIFLELLLKSQNIRGQNLFAGNDTKFFEGIIQGFEIGDWYFTGTAGMFEGYVGNTGFGGLVDSYATFNDWSNYKDAGLEGFYVNKMGKRVGTNTMNLWSDGASLGFGIDLLDSFRFALGTDLGVSFTGFENPYASAGSVNLGAIASGSGLFDLLTFDVFYGIRGKDDNLNDRGNAAKYENRFGIYAGLDILDGLGLSVGYSGALDIIETQAIEKKQDEWITYNVMNPLWSSVHVNANMEIGKVNITFNNNVSFAMVTGKDAKPQDGENVINGLLGAPLVDKYSQNWFGWDAGVGVDFKVTEALTLGLQLVNQLGIFTNKYDKDETTDTGNTIFAGLNAEYNIGLVTFGAGLSLEAVGYTNAVKDGNKGSSTELKLGIPLFFKVEF